MLKLLVAFLIATSAMQGPKVDPDRFPTVFETEAIGQQIKLDNGCIEPDGLMALAKQSQPGPVDTETIMGRLEDRIPEGCFRFGVELVGTIRAIKPTGYKTARTESYYTLVEMPDGKFFGVILIEDTSKRTIA